MPSGIAETRDGFIKKATRIHRNKYNYSKVNYISTHTKVEIICKKCNKIFSQRPSNHLLKHGCPFCADIKQALHRRKSKELFMQQAISIHGDIYNYSKVVYKNSNTKIEVICKKCGYVFKPTPGNHLRGSGCPECSKFKVVALLKKDTVTFIQQADKLHKNKYNYSNVTYVNSKTKVDILCKKCNNILKIAPSSHLAGHGCPICSKKRKKLEKRDS